MNDPAFLFYPGDYLRDTQCLSEKAQVAYDRIMCEHMRNICISHQQVKFFTKRLTDEEIDELSFLLTEVDEGFQITWVAESIVKRREYSESRRNNRKKSNISYDNHMKTHVHHMDNENEIENKDKSKEKESARGSTKSKDFNLDFVDEKFKSIFSLWMEYKTERRESYKSEKSLKTCYERMIEFSGGNPKIADEIVKNSIANNYQGFFKPKIERSSYKHPAQTLLQNTDLKDQLKKF